MFLHKFFISISKKLFSSCFIHNLPLCGFHRPHKLEFIVRRVSKESANLVSQLAPIALFTSRLSNLTHVRSISR
jgi:hypothetical protein